MTTATLIKRMTSTIKAEAVTAANNIDLDGWNVSGDLRTIESDDCIAPVVYFRSGSEVIAVPEFYTYEDDGVFFTGSQGNDYTLFGETLYVGFWTVQP
jgi:hypothetical protein